MNLSDAFREHAEQARHETERDACVCVSMHSHMYTCLCVASHQHLPFSERRFEEYRSSSMVVVVVESSRSERHGQPQTAQSTEALGACSDGSRPGCPTSVVVPGSSEVQMRCDQLPYFRVSSYVTTNSCAACKQGSIPFGTVDFPSGTRIGAWKETNRWTGLFHDMACADHLR